MITSILSLFSCDFALESTEVADSHSRHSVCQETSEGYILTGKVEYVDSTYIRHGGLNARVGAYQNDTEVSCTIVSSENGAFKLTGLDSAVYDIVYTTTEKFRPYKLLDVDLNPASTDTLTTVEMWFYDFSYMTDQENLYISFKKSVSDEDKQEIISESGCSIHRMNVIPGWDELIIPDGSVVLDKVEWFLKRNAVRAAEWGALGTFP